MRKYILLLISILVLLAACQPATRSPQSPQPSLTPRPTRPPTPTPSLPAIKTPAWFNDVVLYEIFPRSFYDTNGDGIGDLKGITAKLDYLNNLGVGALWLTPIFASPSEHGYDTTDYYKINPAFGTEDDLRELVRQAHQHNIRIILDYVIAHTSNQHPFFKDAFGNRQSTYADWYRWTNAEHTTYESFFGIKELPTLNHNNPAVQQYLIEMAKYWMNTGIDGFRCDYVLNVPHAFWKKLRAEVKAIKPDFLLLGEAWTGMADIKPYYEDEFDATFDFPTYGSIQGSHDRVGDSLLIGALSARLLDMNVSLNPLVFPPGAQHVVFLNNHDTNRTMSEVKGDVNRAKLGATLLLTLPYTPMIYYGEEIGMPGEKAGAPDYDKTRREPMDWYAAEMGPGMTNWFKPPYRYNKPNDGISVEEQHGKPGSLLEHYRALIALRNANAALRTGLYEVVPVQANQVYAYLRQDTAASFLMVLNFSDVPASLTIDLGATSLPDGRYVAIDALTRKSYAMEGLALNIDVSAGGGYVLHLARQ